MVWSCRWENGVERRPKGKTDGVRDCGSGTATSMPGLRQPNGKRRPVGCRTEGDLDGVDEYCHRGRRLVKVFMGCDGGGNEEVAGTGNEHTPKQSQAGR